jgi:hypothetical protein
LAISFSIRNNLDQEIASSRLLRCRITPCWSLSPMTDSTDDMMIDTPDGPMTFAAWKKKHPVQIPSRRTRGKDLPVKVKRFTEPK